MSSLAAKRMFWGRFIGRLIAGALMRVLMAFWKWPRGELRETSNVESWAKRRKHVLLIA